MADPHATQPRYPKARPSSVCRTCGETFWDDEVAVCPWDGTPLNVSAGNTLVDRVVGGRYRVVGLIGEGGMGRVYVGEHTLSLERAALKVMRPELLQDPQQRARFLRECRTLEDLDAPHVVKVLEAGVSALGELYLVTELLVGENLGDRIERGTPIPLAESLSIIARIAEALEAVHQLGVVHRDLKPENVFLLEDGSLRVLDFGIARLLDGHEVAGGSRKLTALGTIVGTPAYISPEGAAGREVGLGADLYSLGVMLYELLAGDLPFWDDVPIRMMGMHLKTPPPPLEAVRPDLPPELVALVHRLLEKSPEDRPASATEVLATLRALSPGLVVTPPAASPVESQYLDTLDDEAPAGMASPGPRAASFGAPSAQGSPAQASPAQASPTQGSRPQASQPVSGHGQDPRAMTRVASARPAWLPWVLVGAAVLLLVLMATATATLLAVTSRMNDENSQTSP